MPEFRGCLSAWLTTAAPSICHALILDRPGKTTHGFTWALGGLAVEIEIQTQEKSIARTVNVPAFSALFCSGAARFVSVVFSFRLILFYFRHGEPHFTFPGIPWRANYVNICHDRMKIFVQTLIHFLSGT